MVMHPLKPVALDPKVDERQLDAERLPLQASRAELVEADQIVQMLWAMNTVMAAIYNVRRIEEGE